MLRAIGIGLSFLAASLCASAQTGANDSRVYVPYSGSAGYAGNGYWATSLPASPPLLVTPTMHLSTITPGVGASNAAPGMPVGATSSPSPVQAVPTSPPMVPVIVGAPRALLVNTAAEQELEATESAAPQETGTSSSVIQGAATQSASSTGSRQPFNFGVAPIGRMGGSLDGKSLAEVAAENRSHQGQAARNYTNQDIEQLNQNSGGNTTGGISGAVNAPAANSAPSSTPGAIAEPNSSEQPSRPAAPTTERPAPPPSQAVPPQPQASLEPSQQPATGGDLTNQDSRPARAESRQQLPATAAKLPLVAVVGFAAIAVGLLTRA